MGKALEDVLREDRRSAAEIFGTAGEPSPETKEEPVPEIEMIRIEELDANWKNFYSVDPHEEDLAESIRLLGLMTPLGVMKSYGTRYRVVSGHRRLRALKWLHDTEPDGRERWALVPCVVYDTTSSDREELMLIHANSTAREMTSYEKAEQLRRATEILRRMKKDGAELPGRMRDRAAEAVGVSRTKAARLEAIGHNLKLAGWQQAWEKDRIGESLAYRISQLDKKTQTRLWDHYCSAGIPINQITVKSVEKALEIFDRIDNPPPTMDAGRRFEWREPVREYDPPVEAELAMTEVVSDPDTGDGDDGAIYLLPERVPEFAAQLAGWFAGDPPEEGRYLCTVDLNPGQAEQTCEWKDGQWTVYGRTLDGMFSVTAWWPLPEKYEYWRLRTTTEEEEDDIPRSDQ